MFLLHHIRRCLRQQTQILGQVLNQINDVIVVKDYEGNFVYYNGVVGKLYNADPREMVGKDDFYYTQNREQADFFKENVQSIMSKMEKEAVLESSTDAVTGEIKHFHSVKIPFIDGQQQKRIMVIAKDVTEIIQLKEEADRNKRRLEHVLDVSEEGRLINAMTQSQISKQYNAVLFLDLDRFKLLNDSYGHHMGDKLLIKIDHSFVKDINHDTQAKKSFAIE